MKIFILDEVFRLDNKIESVEEVFDYIKQALDETEYNFSYMIIDGEEVYDEFEIYIEDNIKTIKEVKVIMLTTKEIVKDNLVTIDEYVERAIPIVRALSDAFHKNPNADDWNQISELFEGVGFIFHTLETVDNMENLNEIVSNYEVWNEYVNEVKSLEDVLESLNLAVENKDAVIIGNLLISKIVPAFKNMSEKLGVLAERS